MGSSGFAVANGEEHLSTAWRGWVDRGPNSGRGSPPPKVTYVAFSAQGQAAMVSLTRHTSKARLASTERRLRKTLLCLKESHERAGCSKEWLFNEKGSRMTTHGWSTTRHASRLTGELLWDMLLGSTWVPPSPLSYLGGRFLSEQSGGAETQPTEGTTEVNMPRFVLSGQQRSLLTALERRNEALSTMYQGGLVVLSDLSNPDRHSLCAHAIRELMEKLPRFLEVPTRAQGERLGPKVREIEVAFQRLCQREASSQGVEWHGRVVDINLHKFLQQVEGFFGWFQTHQPRRRMEMRVALEKLDASGRPLPSRLADLNVIAWEDIHEYFLSIAHHGRMAVDSEFVSYLSALERFLLERLEPRTFNDFEEIDKLLDRG